MKKKIIILILNLLLISNLFASVKTSYRYLPFGNGLGNGVYRVFGRTKLISFYDHIYKQYSPNEITQNYVKDGIEWGLNDKWLSYVKVKKANYINGTGILDIKKQYKDIEITENYFMPFETDKRILIGVLRLKNIGKDTELSPYLKVDVSMGNNLSTLKETVNRSGNIFIESNSEKKGYEYFTYLSDLNKFSYKSKKKYPKNLRRQTVALDNTIEKIANNEIGVFQFNKIVLKKGKSKTIFVIMGLGKKDKHKDYLEEISKISKEDGKTILNNEIKFWEKWHSVEKYPKKMKEDEKNLYRQSTTILKMGQSREKGKAYGQILASMPPGQWNISWPRDGAYSIVALLKSGHIKEAKAFLEFMLNAPGGKFTNKKYIGVPYKISACRYYGNGEEWSDYNNHGPNVEFDDFGLFLWAFTKYVETTGDMKFKDRYYNIVKEQIADVIVSLMEKEGYLKADSSIWERHWEKGDVDGKKHFAYSTINGYNGLISFSKIGDLYDNIFYKKEAERIKRGFLNNFILNNVIVSSLEEKKDGNNYADAATVEAINFNMVDEKIALTTLDFYEKNLKMKNSVGFKRSDDGTKYDRQEWLMIDYRIANAYMKYDKKHSYEIIRWSVDNAKANYNLIPELLTEGKSKYYGAIPMCGFGAGAYIITVGNYYLENKR
ncbi:glycoside hydrolase family 15 protein [Haliovirga abyssi]|uniref:Glucoamylase n=1 Tax=Haliovirga abyssi TaxID=2996794 RepID=A0AAU9DYE4_9FUSO|nr:glycoside hydrolase family 15 protein [Haliovirga abyssi]BDU51541.1 glucoamylase [Haliovirga abyssi]